ncbi:MAG: TIR domain-containing protein [Candidatus Sedimenticola sp. (ex Thyasira tokunagai)]
MERDELMTEFRQRLTARSEDYFYKVFNMPKQNVVDPDAVLNLSDLRKRTRASRSEDARNDIDIIHAEIWARSLALIAGLNNLIVQILREGRVPSDDSRVRDYLAALNLISLQYGVLFVIDGAASLSWLLIHDEGLKMHVVIGGSPPRQESAFLYDVALSFAGEDREYVRRVAEALKSQGKRVFYDEFEKARLWGKDLYQHLNEVYKSKSQVCVIFASEYYAKKRWTSHELKSAQARAFAENTAYLLPVRLDDTAIPGLNETVGYVDGRDTSTKELAALLIQKLDHG